VIAAPAIALSEAHGLDARELDDLAGLHGIADQAEIDAEQAAGAAAGEVRDLIDDGMEMIQRDLFGYTDVNGSSQS